MLLRLCYSVDIGQASEFRLRFEPFLSHHFFITENYIIAILSCNAAAILSCNAAAILPCNAAAFQMLRLIRLMFEWSIFVDIITKFQLLLFQISRYINYSMNQSRCC